MGDFAYNLIWHVASLYLLYFYTDVMYLDAAEIAGIFVVCRIIEAITDVLAGYTSDKTHSRWKKPPLFSVRCGTLRAFGISCFQLPEISHKEKLAYAYATYIFPSFMYTVVNIPSALILPAMTYYMNERTVLVTWRKFLAFIGATTISATALSYKYYVSSTYLTSLVATIMTMIPMVANITVPFLAQRLGKRNLYIVSAGLLSADALLAIKAMYLYIPMILPGDSQKRRKTRATR